MLRISRYEAPGTRGTLNVEGKFIGPWVQQVREACDELLSESTVSVTTRNMKRVPRLGS
jgi:hypothetical protein